MCNERVLRQRVGRERDLLETRVEVCNAVLREEADEVEPDDRVLAWRGREQEPVVVVEGLQLREIPLEGGDVSRADGPECADFEDSAWGGRLEVR